MTINEACARADALKPGNQIDAGEKIKWLSEVDGQIKREIMDRHQSPAQGAELPYTSDTDRDAELLASGAYDDLYVYYLCAQIDRVNEEIGKYNNDLIMYNTRYTEFAREWHRSHTPKKVYITGV